MNRPAETHYIFFLVEKNDLIPQWFYHLAKKFASANVTLVPVDLTQLLEFTNDKSKSYLIVSTHNFQSKEYVDKVIQTYLTMAVRKSKVCLFHLSSFREIPELVNMKYRNDYYFHKLPVDMEELAKNISEIYFNQEMAEKEIWPGGRVAKLPRL